MNLLDKIIISNDKQADNIESLKKTNFKTYIYGAGIYAYVLHSYLTQKMIIIDGFVVDKDYISSDQYLGLNVISLEDLLAGLSVNCNIIVGIPNYPSVFNKLQYPLIKCYIIDVPDFLNIPINFMDESFIVKHQSKLENAISILHDDLSKNTLIASINCKLNNDISFLKPYVEIDHLYFSKKVFDITANEVLFDIGGYNGDSITDFINITNFKQIVTFEPLETNYEKINELILKLGLSNKVLLLKLGAWNHVTSLPFKRTNIAIDSKISEEGKTSIEVITIDAAVEKLGVAPSFIKIDINGSEFFALEGAADTIRKYKPKVAVKLHVKDDFYRIPLLLKEISPDVKLLVRQRNFMSMMLVLYAVF